MTKYNHELQQIIFSDSKSYFDSLITDIDSARLSIQLETYIFNKDTLGQRIADALIKAALRGLSVRVLVDGAGTPFLGDIVEKLEQAGAQTRVFHPLPWNLWQLSRSFVKVPLLTKIIYLFRNINLRNHRKVCIIDQKIAYVGSFNISKVHLSRENGGDGWRDTGVKISGLNLQELIKAFLTAWNHLPIQERIHRLFSKHDPEPIIRLNNSRNRRRKLYHNLLNKISHSRKRIWMTNAYFVPDNFLLKYIKDAAQSGIDVRIILPKKSDVFFQPMASSAFYESLLKTGVRIFEYLPSMLHTKTLILDDWIIVGSSNLNHRSLLHDLEVDVNIVVPESKQAIENQFIEDLANSQEIFLSQWQKRPYYQRIFGRLLLYLKYWI